MKTFTYSLYPPCLCMLYLPHTAAYQVNRSDIVYTMPNGVNYFIEKKKNIINISSVDFFFVDINNNNNTFTIIL